MQTFNIDGTELDACLENGEWPDGLVDLIETALSRMKENPGDAPEGITLTIANDFEPEEENEESEDEEEEKTDGA